MTEIKYWLWLTSRSGLSLDGMHRVLTQFGTPMQAYYADPAEYDRLTTLRPVAKAALRDKSMERPEQILKDCDRLGVRISALVDSDYPQRLRGIFQPPLVLYRQGKPIRFDDEVAIAVAGTRRCSDYGRQMAEQLAYEITQQGGLVVTGVAPGCDYAAVGGALRAGGSVVCVLAGGVDIPFDEYSHTLYRKVLDNGALITEHPPGREPQGRNFPQRNRILTGLCLGTLCVEGAHNSGTMGVAKLAMEQNRDIFAVPTGADRPEGAGILTLLKEGAIPVTKGSEVLMRYETRYCTQLQLEPSEQSPLPEQEPVQRRKPRRKSKGESKEPPAVEKISVDKTTNKDYIDVRDHPDQYSDAEQAILLCLQEGSMTGDEVVDRTAIPARQVLATLTILELRGLAAKTGDHYQALVRVR